MRAWRLVVLLGASIIVAGVAIVGPAHALQVQLGQQIEPIDCIYTTTQAGVTATTATNCDDQPVPTVTAVSVNDGRPVVRGLYYASRTALLQVWLYGQWYTLGVDSRLTVDGDMWALDLSGMMQALPSGTYAVIVWAETIGGLVIRNPQAAVFSFVHTQKSGDAPKIPGVPILIPGGGEQGHPSILTSPLLSPPTSYPMGGEQQPTLRVDYDPLDKRQPSAAQTTLIFWGAIAALGLFGVYVAVRRRRRSS